MVSTYAIDSYKPVAGQVMVAITVNKNVWGTSSSSPLATLFCTDLFPGYGYSEFLNVWAAESGFIPPIMTNASLILFFCLLGIPFYYFGKTFRRWSKNSNVHKMEGLE